MEETFAASIISAAWLGILTSISPCPLATNIAAISFISKDVGSKKIIFRNGLLYTLGRMIAYMAIAIILVFSLTSVPEIARFLQKYINMMIGPLLIIIGMLLLNVIKLGFIGGNNFSEYMKKKAEKKGSATAFMIGFLFALSFCPVSAGLFFGSLIPISLREGSGIILPLVYGIGTALPVIVFAFILAFSAGSIGKVYNMINKFQFWAQRVTGVVFIGAGIYLSYTYLL